MNNKINSTIIYSSLPKFSPYFKCLFGMVNFLSLFLLLFMCSNALFSTIYRSNCIISTNFYLYLQYFHKKNFSFSEISGSQTDPKIKTYSILVYLNFLLILR